MNEKQLILSCLKGEVERSDRIKIVKSPHELLSKAAIEAVKQWKYEPMHIEDKPVPIIFTVTCTFKLKGKEEGKTEKLNFPLL